MSKRIIIKAAVWVGALAVFGKISGIAREMIIAAVFGTTRNTDAYFIGMTVSDFLREITAGGVLAAVFIPAYSAALLAENEKPARGFFSAALAVVLAFLAAASIFNVLAAPRLVKLVAPGLDIRTAADGVTVARMMSPAIFLMGFAAFVGGALNARKHFAAPAAFQAMLNTGVILGAALWGGRFGVYSLAAGFVAGAFFQAAAAFFAAKKMGMMTTPSFDEAGELKKMFPIWLPLFAVSIFSTANDIVSRSLASFLDVGSIAAVSFANRIRETVWLFCAAPLGVAVFPYLSDHAARRDEKSVGELTAMAMRLTALLAAPFAAYTAVFSKPLIAAIFERGLFDARSTEITARALFFYGPGAMFYALNYVLLKTYYSMGAASRQLKIFAFAFVGNLAAGIFLAQRLGIGGIALARSAADMCVFAALMLGVLKFLPAYDTKKVAGDVAKIFAAAAACAVFSFGIYNVLGAVMPAAGIGRSAAITAAVKLFIASAPAAPLYLLICKALGVREISLIVKTARAKLKI